MTAAAAASPRGRRPSARPHVPRPPWAPAQLRAKGAASPGVAAEPGLTGLPAGLKAGVEALSGLAMDDVRVHRNSPEPARLGAFAYTRGSEIHVGPGEERHLPHEAWHVVQQKQGRVRPSHQYKGLEINADPALESEADRMGERAAAAGASPAAPPDARPVALPTGSGAAAPVQCAWRIIMNGTKSFAFWLDEGEIDRPAKPSAWNDYPEQPAPAGHLYYLSENRAQRGKEPAHNLARWTEIYGRSVRQPTDTYNPFGRFTTANITSFVPSPEMPGDRYTAIRDEFLASDKNFQAYSPELTAQLQKEDPRPATQQGYPGRIVTDQKAVLSFVSASPFGATYSDTVPERRRAIPDLNKVGLASDLKWAQDVPGSPKYKEAASSTIDPETLKSWHGKERSKQQHEVMGMSAADAAANAGFDPAEGHGWEWLHLIAHSMGGIEVEGPQVATNLVAGTSECNTQMIIVEEFLKDIINKTGGKARLMVYASMFDEARHIGEYIGYDFVIHDKLGKPITVYHWKFDCLSRTNPLVGQNRELRYAGRGVFGIEKADKSSGSKNNNDVSKSYDFGFKSKFDPSSMSDKPAGAGLGPKDIQRALATMPKDRQAQIAVILGLDPGNTGPKELVANLVTLDFDVVMDIIAGSSIGVQNDAQVIHNLDGQLAEMGLARQPSNSTGFICLIDSIRQLLEAQALAVNGDQLVQAVHLATGRGLGDMLEIIGAEGSKVMEAVDSVVFATHKKHIRLVAHVLIVMPDGSVVPFYRANRFAVHGGEEIDLQLLFVNNNHYEPLFDV